MAKEPIYDIDQQDCIFNETFTDEQTVLRNSGNSNAGTISVVFRNGVAIFDNSAIGLDNHISYPRSKLQLSEPERAFSIRTKVYLTDTDASVFLQLYISGADSSKTLRFMIGGNWPAVNMNDKFVLELWDNVGLSVGELTRGRMYDQVLTTLALNKWTEFVATYDGRGGATPEAGICLYMNGVRVDDADVSYGGGVYSGMNYHSDLPLEIGKNVEGKMEFLKVYNKVLTPEEIYNMYN